MKRTLVLILTLPLALGACKRETKRPSPPKPPPQKSSAATLIDGMTGRTAVRSGRKANEEIRRISADKNAALEEVLGE